MAFVVGSHESSTLSTFTKTRLTLSKLTWFIFLTTAIFLDMTSSLNLPSGRTIRKVNQIDSTTKSLRKGHHSSTSGSNPRKMGGKLGHHLRPSPSDDLPVLPLKYPKNKYAPPTEKDMDVSVLMKQLGMDYDPVFSSIVQPFEDFQKPNGSYLYDHKAAGRLIADIRLEGIVFPGRFGPETVNIRSEKRRVQLHKYLVAYTQCPVHIRWRDLGVFYFPRWIREGDCKPEGAVKPRSCSIPPGMTCKTHRSTEKTLLWWLCTGVKDSCRWMPIKYPIITACSCSCART